MKITQVKKTLLKQIKGLDKRKKIYYQKVIKLAEKRPILTFVFLLAFLLALIVLSNLINKPKPKVSETSLVAREVSVYTIGSSPKITVQAEIEKSGVFKVVALSGGVVQSIGVEVGQEVNKGQNLVSMSTNYQGGNAFSIQRQIAQTQYKNVLDTYQANKDLISKQREIAEKSEKNADELRKISNDSLGSTRSLIDLNNGILSTLDDLINSSANDQASLPYRQMKSQLLSGNNQLQSALKNAEYSGNDSNAQTSEISKEITLKQLDIQEKALRMNKEISRLGVVLAQVNEAIMFPSSPCSGIVERIYVNPGQTVSPGTPLVQISGNSKELIAVALLSRELAEGVSRAQVSTLHFGSFSFDLAPFYVSSEATDGQLYSAQFAVPSEVSDKVSDKEYITIDIPVDFPKTGSVIPYVPIDAIFQTQEKAFLFIAKQGKAETKTIELGQVIGRFVEVKKGLNEEDQVILTRNVIKGDPIKIVNSKQ